MLSEPKAQPLRVAAPIDFDWEAASAAVTAKMGGGVRVLRADDDAANYDALPRPDAAGGDAALCAAHRLAWMMDVRDYPGARSEVRLMLRLRELFAAERRVFDPRLADAERFAAALSRLYRARLGDALFEQLVGGPPDVDRRDAAARYRDWAARPEVQAPQRARLALEAGSYEDEMGWFAAMHVAWEHVAAASGAVGEHAARVAERAAPGTEVHERYHRFVAACRAIADAAALHAKGQYAQR